VVQIKPVFVSLHPRFSGTLFLRRGGVLGIESKTLYMLSKHTTTVLSGIDTSPLERLSPYMGLRKALQAGEALLFMALSVTESSPLITAASQPDVRLRAPEFSL
jgi:hypothetical protein